MRKAHASELKAEIRAQIHRMASTDEAEDPQKFVQRLTRSMVPSLAKNAMRAHHLIIPLITEVVNESVGSAQAAKAAKAGVELKNVAQTKIEFFSAVHADVDRALERTQTDLGLLVNRFARRKAEVTNSKDVQHLGKMLGMRLDDGVSDVMDCAMNAVRLIESFRKELTASFNPEYEEAKQTTEFVPDS